MKLIERILLALVGLLLITLITVFFMAPEVLNNILEGLQNVNIVLRLAVVLVLDVLILAFVYSRLRSPRVTVEGLVVKAPGAITDIGIESARARILNGVQAVPNVIAADVNLEAVRGKAKIDLNVTVRDSNVNVPRKHQEISQALKQVINKQLGLSMLGQPRVHIHLDDERVVPVVKPKEELPKLKEELPKPKEEPPKFKEDLSKPKDEPIKPKEEPPALPPKTLNGLSPLVNNPPVTPKDKDDTWLESYDKKTDEEKKNGDAVVKP